ncbi:MAG: beta-galactosidase [Eubacterium sp.]
MKKQYPTLKKEGITATVNNKRNMTDYLFGAAYYDEYMPYERLEKDMQMMRKAGFNVIRIAESTWSTLEPKCGEFDFTHIDRVLNAAQKYGLSVIIGTPTYAVASWLVRLDKDVLLTGKNARAHYGTRQNMDITNKTYRKYAKRVIRKLVEHTACHPCVIGFQLDNETKHYGTAGENVQNLFKKYLIEKFKTPDAMNKAYGLNYWSNSIADWEDFPDISDPQNASIGCAFDEFRRSLVTEFINQQSNIVREYKKDYQFITHNFDFDWKFFGPDGSQDGYSRGVQPDACHYDIDKALTLTGVDIYHKTQKHLTGMEIAFAGSEMRALKDKPYLVIETQAQAFYEFLPFPNQIRLQAMANIAAGACGIMYWNWHSIHNGKETYWKGILSHDFEENPTYREICETGEEIKRISPLIKGFEKKNRAALLVDNESLTALKWFPVHKNLSYNDIIIKYYTALYEMNIECDIVYAKSLDFQRYDFICAPALYCVSDEITNALKSFVFNGGVLLSGFKSFVADRNVKVSHNKLPNNMTDVFGITYNQMTRPEDVTVDCCKAQYFMELLKPLTADTLFKYNHPVWGSYTAVSANNYGKGKAYYIGFFPDERFLKKIMKTALTDAGMEIPQYQFPLIIKNGIIDGRKITFALNFSDEKQTVKCCFDSMEILENKKIGADTDSILDPWGVKIFKECKKE